LKARRTCRTTSICRWKSFRAHSTTTEFCSQWAPSRISSTTSGRRQPSTRSLSSSSSSSPRSVSPLTTSYSCSCNTPFTRGSIHEANVKKRSCKRMPNGLAQVYRPTSEFFPTYHQTCLWILGGSTATWSTATMDVIQLIRRAVEELFFNALTHCVNFFSAIINALLTHPGPSRGRVGVSYPGPRDVWGPRL